MRAGVQRAADLAGDALADLHQTTGHGFNVARVFAIVGNFASAHVQDNHLGRHAVPNLVQPDHLARAVEPVPFFHRQGKARFVLVGAGQFVGFRLSKVRTVAHHGFRPPGHALTQHGAVLGHAGFHLVQIHHARAHNPAASVIQHHALLTAPVPPHFIDGHGLEAVRVGKGVAAAADVDPSKALLDHRSIGF